MNSVVEQDRPLAARTEFGSQSRTLAVVETASSAVAAQAKAMVESRYVMSLQRPRIWDEVRQNLLAECRRPKFAHNTSAFYHKPIGKGVEGLGIRFVELALRCMRNVLIEPMIIFEDTEKEVHRVSVTDLESNITYALDVRVSKTVERSKPMDDGSYISMRLNIWNKPTYTVPATDDDLLNKRAALISKAIRTLGLRIIPGDLQDEAEEIIKEIRTKAASNDPAAERKRIADAFAEIGVKVAELIEYLGHPLDTCSPPELVQLRGIYGAIKDGEATWKQVMDNKAQEGDGGGNAGAGTGGGGGVTITWSEEDFGKSLKAWTKLINTGKKTPEQIIATATTKLALTEDQKKIILAIKKPEPKGEATAADLAPAIPEAIASIREKAAKAEISEAEIAKRFGFESLDKILATQVQPILAFLANPAGN